MSSTIRTRTPLEYIALGIVLLTALAALYFLAYRGGPLSIDEISTFDSIESFTQHGTLSRTIEFYKNPTIAPDGSPFLIPLYEPLQIVAASPLFWLAQTSQHIGQFHAVYLLNIFVTAFTAVSLYGIGLYQGYTLRSAWVGAFVFGTATLALPYSRWLFREPLMAFFVLWAFAAAFDLRQRLVQHRPLLASGLVLLISIIGMMLTKQVGILFIPGILICLIPPLGFFRRIVPFLAALLLLLAVFVVVMALANPDFGDDRYSLTRWLDPASYGFNHMLESLIGYQLSPARSFWLYSPILLVGFLGIVYLLKRETRWLVFGIVTTLLLSSAAYGALRLGTFWNGGFSWGPRYMLPLIPLWMLLIFPVIERLPDARAYQRLAFYALAVISVSLQVLGIAVPFTYFYGQYYPVSTGADGWLAENWAWQPSAIEYHLRSFGLESFDSAWTYSKPAGLTPLLLFVLLVAALATGAYIARVRKIQRLRLYFVSAVLPLLLGLGLILGLLTLRDDSRYIGDRQDVYDLIRELNSLSTSDDLLFISGSDYMAQFMNGYKTGALYIVLPDDAGETAAPTNQQITPDLLTDAMGPEVSSALKWAADNHDRIWLILSPTAYLPEHPHLLSRYLDSRMFAVQEVALSPLARAVAFATGRELVFGSHQLPGSPVFGQQIVLESIETPDLDAFSAGTPLPLALVWNPLTAIDENLQLSVQLLNSNGQLVAQHDSALQSEFGRGTVWQSGSTYRANDGLMLPRDLAPGEYSVQIVLYRLETLERLPVTVDGAANAADSLLVAHITVR